MTTPGGIRPGGDRRLELIDGDEALLVRTIGLVGESGALTCEVGYERADGVPLGDDEDVPDGVPVRWYVEATYRHKTRGRRPITRTIRGESGPVPNGRGDHKGALREALVAFLRTAGAGVELIDRA